MNIIFNLGVILCAMLIGLLFAAIIAVFVVLIEWYIEGGVKKLAKALNKLRGK